MVGDMHAEHFRHIASLSPLELHQRIQTALSVLQARFPESPDRLAIERLLEGLPLEDVATMEGRR